MPGALFTRRVAALLGAISLAGGCTAAPTNPSGDPVAVIRVSDEVFRIRLDTPDLQRAARAAMNGGPASIPNGVIARGTDVNVGWSWHLRHVEFVEVTIELCDGRPSMVEREGQAFGGGRFCPWGARVVAIE
jgi:hypothetical protein